MASEQLKRFLNEHSKSGYYAEHGAGFEAASYDFHADMLARHGHSLINSHASRSGNGVWFHGDLTPLSYDQHVARVAV